MNPEELACFNAIKVIENYLNRNIKDSSTFNIVIQHVSELKTFHSMSVGYRVIKESNNG